MHAVSDPEFGQGMNLAWLVAADGTEEFIAFRDVTIEEDGSITLTHLARGCLDTAPMAFPLGTRIWFVSYAIQTIGIRHTGMNTLRFQPFNNRGDYPFESCEDCELTSIDPPRPERVYCPCFVAFNDLPYPESITGELTVDWWHRNRLGSWSYAQSGATDESEPGTEYDVLVYGELGTLVHTETGLTGMTWTYPEAEEIAESGLGRLNNHLRVIIRTFGDSRAHQAIREIEWEFDRDL